MAGSSGGTWWSSVVSGSCCPVPCIGSSFEREGHHYYEFKDDGLHLIRVDLWDTSWNRAARGAAEPPPVGLSSP